MLTQLREGMIDPNNWWPIYNYPALYSLQSEHSITSVSGNSQGYAKRSFWEDKHLYNL